jgi:phage-related protein
MYDIYYYKDRRGQEPVRELIDSLNKKSQAKVYRYLDLLKQMGPNLLRPYADSVKDKIRELRVRTSDGNIRVFYFFFIEKTVILLHGFKKKTQELPEGEIEKAKNCMMDFIERYNKNEFSD